MWKIIRTGRVLTSIFEQSHIVISVRVRATVTGVHNLNSSSFCNDIEMDYRVNRRICQGSNVSLWIKMQIADHLRVLFRVVQTEIAMTVSGEDFQGAVRNYVIQQFSGCADRCLLFAAENDMYLCPGFPKSGFYGIGTVAF